VDEAWLGIADAGRLFRSRDLSPVQLTRRLLERIARLDGRCNAFLGVSAELALSQARTAEAELAAGNDRGPLHGIPYALKDIIDVAGMATTCHSRILRDNIATRDAQVVVRLREAGAVLLGKVALHEFATGGPATDLPWPPARNPWNLALHPGGSSSGSGVALAAGLAPAAVGTDTGGSVRNPATCCGVVGMKPTFGLVSCEGVFPLAPSLDHVGPMTRDAEDNALLLEAMTGRPGAYTKDLRAGLRGLRIGIIEHFYTEDDSAHPEQLRGIVGAADAMRELGATLEPIRLPNLAEWRECGRVIQQFEQYAVHERWLTTRQQDYCELSRAKLLPGAGISRTEVETARAKRRALTREFEQAMSRFDAAITLSNLAMPCRIDRPDEIARTYLRHLRMPFNLTGTPAVSVPTGFSAEGLPLAMQIAGKAHDEATLYRIAWAYSRARPSDGRRPAL
jgi:aspartyl-tRNA(Asn)/glutamyl-tRNA(Gln) amidotransferase subunit A